MKHNTLSPELDLLCKTLCKRVLNIDTYQSLSSSDLNMVSTFLIRFNPAFSSSRESLNKSLQNWFSGRNTPSNSKLEEISKSLGYSSYRNFVAQNHRKIQTSHWKQATSLSLFQKSLLACSLALIFALGFPMIFGLTIETTEPAVTEGSELLASVIQAVVVIMFYIFTRFFDFGGRDQIVQSKSIYPKQVSHSLSQFFTGWKFLWLSFSILYLWFCVLYGFELHSNAYAQSLSDIITIFSSLCFAYLFSVMDVESTPSASSSKTARTFDQYLIVFVVGLSSSSIISILDRYYNLGGIDGIGTYILGYSNVIVMLYFFGRLESHYLNVNRLVLLPLYTYAIIQIAYVLFFANSNGGQSFEAYVIGMVLVLKGFLYFLIREWIKEGKMGEYFLRQHERSRK